MKLTIFYADKGDSLLLTGADKKSMLIDGGTPSAYPDFVAPRLKAALPAGGKLDVVVLSHIDEDHIGGVLGLLNDAFEWKIYDLHQQAGDTQFAQPASSRPPAVLGLWHNAFHELVSDNVGDIREMLAANALGLRLVDAPWARHAGARSATIANSIPQAMRVSRRVSADQLKIPLNAPANGKLMLVRDGQAPVKVGGMKATVIGPQPADLTKLRVAWNKWLKDQANRATIDKIRDQGEKDAKRIQASYPRADAERLAQAAQQLGDRTAVTPPNLASLMLHVEEAGSQILLTGDGHSDDVEKGLEATGKLAPNTGLHVQVLKVPHHGSEHNTTKQFPRRITADHYVFCGNGFMRNPELEVIKAYLESRLSHDPARRSPNLQAGNKFHFWFSCDATKMPTKYRPHMKRVTTLVKQAASGSGGKLQVHFLSGNPLAVTV